MLGAEAIRCFSELSEFAVPAKGLLCPPSKRGDPNR